LLPPPGAPRSAVDERALGGRLGVADAGLVVDVRVDPVEDREHAGSALRDVAELARGEPDQLVGRAVAARGEILQHLLGKLAPRVLRRRFGKRDALAVVDHRLVADRGFSREQRAEAPLAARVGMVLDEVRRGRHVQALRKDRLVARLRRLHRGDDLGLGREIVD
jgi:hypothetical protein